MQRSKKAALTTGPIGKTLVELTLPMIVGILSMVAFNLVDTFFVGRLGTHQLAAVGFTFPVVLIVSSIAVGLGMGASAVISRAVGEGDHQQVQRLTTDSLFLSVSIVAVFLTIGYFTIEPVFRTLGATDLVMPHIRAYMQVWYAGIIFVIIPMVGNNAIRATGDTRTPSLIMVFAVLANVTLDPLLIFGIGPFPRLELAGAALATVLSRALTLVLSLWVLYHRERMITLARPALAEVIDSWRRILYIGAPAAAANAIFPLGMSLLTGLVALYGPAAVAAFGVAARIDMLALTVVMALATVLAPFVGQNMGAGRPDRVAIGVRYSHLFSVAWGTLMAVLLMLLARPIAAIFNDDPVVINNIVLYLGLAPLGYGLYGVVRLSNSALNVLNKPFQASALMAIQMFGLYVPLAYLGSAWLGLTGIFGAAAVANISAGLLAFVWLRRVVRTSQTESTVVRVRAARLWLQLGRPDLTRTVLSPLPPGDVDRDVLEGLALWALGEPRQAIPVLTRAVSNDPTRRRAWRALVDCLVRVDDCDAARTALDSARRHHPALAAPSFDGSCGAAGRER